MEMNSENQLSTDQPRAGLSSTAGILIGIGIGIALSLVCLALIAGSVWVGSTDMTSECAKRGSSLSDTLRVQMFAPSIFERPTWTESFSSSPDRVSKTWYSNELSAVSYLEYLVYNCGYEPTYMETYYTDENFETTIFQNYQNVKKTAECSQNGLQHYEFNSKFQDQNYRIYYWVKQEGDTRMLGFTLAFPATQEDELQKYARRVYPDLAVCE